MRYSTKLSDSIHILSYIYLFSTNDLSSKAISESIQTNPASVRRLMTKLREADLLKTTPGMAKPKLNRSPEKITLYDIYEAVEGGTKLFHVNPHTNMNCPAGANIQKVLESKYENIQLAAEKQLAKETLADVISELRELGNF